MGENGLSAADVALLSDKNGCCNGWADSSFMWIFALLILANGGGFGWGNNGFANAIGYNNLATQNDVQRGFDNLGLQDQSRDILGAVTNGTAQTIAASTQNATNAIEAIKDGNAALIREFGNVETALTALGGKQQECCCNTLRAIDGVNYNNALNTANLSAAIAQNRYDAALNTAAINENITDKAQKIMDMFTGNRMADMQQQINSLELQNQLASVVRYPNNTFYSVPSPCFSTGCGCGNI
jgi:hypothetical protein